jgi:3-oxoadipate enol-lactonase
MAEPTDEEVAPATPDLPPGRSVELPGRGTTFIREVGGPPGAPTVLLLHGWTATADLNWFTSFAALGRRFRVLAMDHRGHGRGIRTSEVFRLRDCADDGIALADELGIERVIPVGYSMGGPVAQLMWRRHRDRVDGLVLCATANRFSTTRDERLAFAGMSALARAARMTPSVLRDRLSGVYLARRAGRYDTWAMEQVGRHDWTKILEAGRAIGRFSSREWIADVDVPSALVLTRHDLVVPPVRQQKLADAIPGTTVHPVEGGHDACATVPDQFSAALVDACASVVLRSSPVRLPPP